MRKYVVRNVGSGFRVSQEDSVEFADAEKLEEYIQRQERELDRLRKQQAVLDEVETALQQHIAELRTLKPKTTTV